MDSEARLSALLPRASLVAQTVKNLGSTAGDPGSIPGLGGSPGEGTSYGFITCGKSLVQA